jgi:sodium-dependent dicarboxylate transporter 2/3/5
MAYTAGAGSVITLLGAARGAVAIGFFKDMTGNSISFFEFSYYLLPIGWLMMFLLWGLIMLFFKPEKKTIPGLRQRAMEAYAEMAHRKKEILTAVIVFAASWPCLRSFIPVLDPIDKRRSF